MRVGTHEIGWGMARGDALAREGGLSRDRRGGIGRDHVERKVSAGGRESCQPWPAASMAPAAAAALVGICSHAADVRGGGGGGGARHSGGGPLSFQTRPFRIIPRCVHVCMCMRKREGAREGARDRWSEGARE
jgi:hypothetical protein